MRRALLLGVIATVSLTFNQQEILADSGPAQEQPTTRTPLESGRPLIVFIHGRNQQARQDHDLRNEWFAAFREGISKIGASDLIAPDDYTMVLYQDLYRDEAVVSCPADEEEARQRLAPLIEAQQSASREAAKSRDAARDAAAKVDQHVIVGLGVPDKSWLVEADKLRRAAYDANLAATAAGGRVDAATIAITRDMERNIAERDQRDAEFRIKNAVASLRDKVRAFFARSLAGKVAQIDEAMALLFPDTQRYISEFSYRCATDSRLHQVLAAAQLSERPVILVGHSMGTLVAFNMLHYDSEATAVAGRRATHEIAFFVSLGSQLGIRELMQGFFGGFRPPLPCPRSIRAWRNLRAKDDYVAPVSVRNTYDVKKTLYSEFQITTTPGSPHNIVGYLRNQATATTIVTAWCGAFRAGTSDKPRRCTDFTDLPYLRQLPGGTKAIAVGR